MIDVDLREINSFSRNKRTHVVKTLIALSKHLGVYEDFKMRLKNYGIKLESPDSFRAFIRIMEGRDGLFECVKNCLSVLNRDLATFIKFATISGLRKEEVVKSFNRIIMLSQKRELVKYCNFELKALKHFKYERGFLKED